MKDLKYWWYRNMPWYVKINISPTYKVGDALLVNTSGIGENKQWIYCGKGIAVLLNT